MRSDFTITQALTIGVVWAVGMTIGFRYFFIAFGL